MFVLTSSKLAVCMGCCTVVPWHRAPVGLQRVVAVIGIVCFLGYCCCVFMCVRVGLFVLQSSCVTPYESHPCDRVHSHSR